MASITNIHLPRPHPMLLQQTSTRFSVNGSFKFLTRLKLELLLRAFAFAKFLSRLGPQIIYTYYRVCRCMLLYAEAPRVMYFSSFIIVRALIVLSAQFKGVLYFRSLQATYAVYSKGANYLRKYGICKFIKYAPISMLMTTLAYNPLPRTQLYLTGLYTIHSFKEDI